MVARRDHVGAHIEQLIRDRRRQPEAPRSVFSIDDKQVDGVRFDDVRQVFPDNMTAGEMPEHVADKEDIHSKKGEHGHLCRAVRTASANAWPLKFIRSPRCGSFLCKAQIGRFPVERAGVDGSGRGKPDAMHTSKRRLQKDVEGERGDGALRRTFLLLHKAGLIDQRKGPNGGAKLKLPAKQIGLGDVFIATEADWLILDDKTVAPHMKKVRSDAVAAMNEHSLSGVVKRLNKSK